MQQKQRSKWRIPLWSAFAGIYCLLVQVKSVLALAGERSIWAWLSEGWSQHTWSLLWTLLGWWGVLGVAFLLYALVEGMRNGTLWWEIPRRVLPAVIAIGAFELSKPLWEKLIARMKDGTIDVDTVVVWPLVLLCLCVLLDHFVINRRVDWGFANLRNTRMIVFAALMVAMARALSLIPSIPIFHTKMSFGFLARAMCAVVCGPVVGLVYGFVEDILGFILQPSGEFFFGYTISTMLGVLIYAVCFYRRRITVVSILIANIAVNLLVNALLGSVWTVMTRGDGNWAGYWGWFVPSLIKNVAMIAPKTILLYILFNSMMPILRRIGVLSPKDTTEIKLF